MSQAWPIVYRLLFCCLDLTHLPEQAREDDVPAPQVIRTIDLLKIALSIANLVDLKSQVRLALFQTPQIAQLERFHRGWRPNLLHYHDKVFLDCHFDMFLVSPSQV